VEPFDARVATDAAMEFGDAVGYGRDQIAQAQQVRRLPNL